MRSSKHARGQHSSFFDEKEVRRDSREEKREEKIQRRDINAKQERKNKKSFARSLRNVIIKFLFIALLIYVCFFWVFGLTRMKDLSMRPTIQPGSLVLYYRLDKNYVVGDVVTYKKDGKRYISRIIALPNDEVYLSNNGDFITKNGSETHQVYFENVIPEDSTIRYPYKVGANQVFVLGDYRIEANDSRSFGAIDINSIDGKVISFMQTKDI